MKFFTTSKLSENIRATPEGYLVCLGVSIARTGEQIYGVGETPIEPGPDGRVIILRDAAEVFRPETIASFEGKSFTVLHPKDFVDPKNWKQLTSGIVQNVRRGEGEQDADLVADILVTDAHAIALVKAGVREVSCGYEAEYYESGRGRGVQKNIIGNHVALVEAGRAGEAYAINDHKGKGHSMKFGEKIKAIFARAQDEALKIAGDEKPEEKKEEKKDESKDASSAYDKLCAMAKDFGALVESMKPASDEKPVEEKKEESKDEPVAASLEDRLKKLEDMVAKLAESKAPAADEKEEKEESEDGDDEAVDEEKEEKKEESKDGDDEEEEVSDESESELVGDTASRIEILAPGLKATGKDAKVAALRACYATTDGKAIIGRFTGEKELDYGNKILVDSVFVAASEILKLERAKALSGTRTFDFQASSLAPTGALKAEDINKKNEAHYGNK